MASLLDRAARAPRMLWIDADEYAGHLLADGVVRWTDAAALIAWHRQAMTLVKSDVAALRVASVAAAWIAADAELFAQMRERRRPLAPLRHLLACEPLRAHLQEVLGGLRFNNADTPLVLMLPSPRAWLVHAFMAAHGETPEIDDEDVESAATYVADFLRAFAQTGIDAVLLELADGEDAAAPSAADIHQPLLNVAHHYGWQIGLQWAATATPTAAPSGFDFAIAPAAIAGLPTGLQLPLTCWASGAPVDAAATAFVYASVPAQMRPETVLERIAGWR